MCLAAEMLMYTWFQTLLRVLDNIEHMHYITFLK